MSWEVSALLYKETDDDEYIQNMSSYEFSFFWKWVLFRDLKFAIPQRVSPTEVKASFEKAYWSLAPHLGNDNLKGASDDNPTIRSTELHSTQSTEI